MDDEWKIFEDYALERIKDFTKNERDHTICEALAVSAELENRKNAKGYWKCQAMTHWI